MDDHLKWLIYKASSGRKDHLKILKVIREKRQRERTMRKLREDAVTSEHCIETQKELL